MSNSSTKRIGRQRRHARIRSTVAGTAARPRFSIYKSNRYMHAQLIDDEQGKTLLGGSTKDLAKGLKKGEAARELGIQLAKQAKSAGITEVVFDRGGFRYTGRVATIAEAAREGGLIF